MNQLKNISTAIISTVVRLFLNTSRLVGPKPTKAKTFKIYQQKLNDYVSCLSYKKMTFEQDP